MQPLSLRWIIGIAVLIITAGTLLVAVNQSSYLKSQALIPEGEGAPEAIAVDDYTRIEAYCQQHKETCLTYNCSGYAFSYQQTECNPACERGFQECLAETAIDEVIASEEQAELLTNHGDEQQIE